VIGKPPITRFLWVCRQRSYYGADRADRRFRGLERDKPAEEARKRMGNATVEGLGTLPPALKLTRSLELEEKELPLLYHLDAVLEGSEMPATPTSAGCWPSSVQNVAPRCCC
jgi:hypothetical protein